MKVLLLARSLFAVLPGPAARDGPGLARQLAFWRGHCTNVAAPSYGHWPVDWRCRLLQYVPCRCQHSVSCLLCLLMAIGFDMALNLPTMTSASIESAPRERSSMASAVLNAGRQAGSALGVAFLGMLVGSSAALCRECALPCSSLAPRSCSQARFRSLAFVISGSQSLLLILGFAHRRNQCDPFTRNRGNTGDAWQRKFDN